MDTITTATPKQAPPANSLLIPATAWFGTQRGVAQPVPLTQYDDTLPVLAVALYLNGQPYTVPEGAAINIRMDKRDGHYIYNPAYGLSDDRKIVYVAVTLQMTTGAGEYWPILELVVDGDVAGTSVLPMYIAKNPVPEDAVESTDEWKSIQQIVAEVEEAAQVVQQNAQNLQNLTDNLEAVQNAAANAQAAAASAAAAQQAAQEALGFRTFFGAVTPDENGDLDPSRPMTTPTAASVTVKSKGDRIQSVQVNGFTTQAGAGDPSPANVRAITVAAQDGTLPITLTGGQTVTESLKLTAPLCAGDKVESCVPSGCNVRTVFDGSSDENWALSGSSITGFIRATYFLGDSLVNSFALSDRFRAGTAIEWSNPSSINGEFVTTSNGSLCVQVKTDLPNTIDSFKSILQESPLTLLYKTTAYTEANDIPVQLETHASTIVTVDGTNTLFAQGTDGYAVTLLGAANGAVTCNRFSGLTAANNTVTIPASQFPSSVTDVDSANTWAQSNPVTILYPLSAPAIYAHDPVTLVAVPYTQADVDAANQLANTPSTLPAIDSPDVPMLLDEIYNEDFTAQVMALAANAVPVVGTYVVSSQSGTTLAVSLKAMQDGGDTSAWVDSLSQYYTKTEADARFLGAGDETVVRFVEISIDDETGAVTFTDPQFDFAFLAGCIRKDGETCVVRVKGVAATYSPNEWSEADDGAVTLSFRDHGYLGDSSERRVYFAPTLEITQRGGAVTGRRVNYIYNTLPNVDASDDGKTLRVVDGAWQVMTPPVYTAVFPASGWVEMDGGGYEQTAACAGMTADITPQPPTVQTTGTAETDKAALAALACIQAVQTLAGQVRALCYDNKPATDVTIYLTEVR